MDNNPFAVLAGYKTRQPERAAPKAPRQNVLARALKKVEKMEVGQEVKIVSNKATVDILRRKTGLSLISFGYDSEKGTCFIRRLPDGTVVKRGMKVSQFR